MFRLNYCKVLGINTIFVQTCELWTKKFNEGQIDLSRQIYAKSADMMGGGFFVDKGEGRIQNVENYGIEVPSKTAGLYLVPKLRNLILWDFVGFGGFWGGFVGIFGVSMVWGVCRTRGRIGFDVLVKTQGRYQLPKLRKLIFFVFLAVQGVFLWLICKK